MSDLLNRLRKLTDERDEAQFHARELDQQWRQLISAAITAGLPVQHIATVTGITTRRVYQIRDNKR